MLTIATTETASSSMVLHDVRAFIVENFLLGKDSGFDNNESLLESGIIDSTGIMHVVAFLEERFGISIDDDDLISDNLESVTQIAAFVTRKQAVRQAA